jgi:nucleotide-binding universal stress UspA family protein
MWDIKKILVPVDLSDPENALNTSSFAQSFAEEFSAELYVIYVYQIPTFIDLLSAPLTFLKSKEALAEKTKATAQKQLSSFLEKTSSSTIKPKGLIRAGVPYEEILKTIQELTIDLIVIGTRALKGIDHLLLGSTAERVVRMAGSPVITIKPKNFRFTMP